ncbi:unnamed protein product, partial [Ixodes pacificus]
MLGLVRRPPVRSRMAPTRYHIRVWRCCSASCADARQAASSSVSPGCLRISCKNRKTQTRLSLLSSPLGKNCFRVPGAEAGATALPFLTEVSVVVCNSSCFWALRPRLPGQKMPRSAASGKNSKVRMASQSSTTWGLKPSSTIRSHRPAEMTASIVLRTLTIRMVRISVPGMPVMQTAVMTSRLNAADPTMVPGPRSPASKLQKQTHLLPMISMMASKISGALEPSAMSVRLATVSFQTLTSMTSG